MAQIGKDYYEDLTAEGFAGLLDAFARGEVPRPGPQNGRFASEPLGRADDADRQPRTVDANASVTLAERLGDTVARIIGDEPSPRTAVAGMPKRPRIDAARARATMARRWRRCGPAGLAAPRGAGPDDLKLIKGVGPVLEAMLHRLGYFHFDQIAPGRRRRSPGSTRISKASTGGSPARAGSSRPGELAEEGETPHAQERIRDE